MPLATSSISQLERAQIDQEWEEERAYPLANLSTARSHRRGLRFVKATKSDEEWSRECRENRHASWLAPPKSSNRNDNDEVVDFYRNLARRSGTSTPNATANTVEDTPMAKAAKRRRREQGDTTQQPLASTSKLTLEDIARTLPVKLVGQGSKEVPLELDDDDTSANEDTQGTEEPEQEGVAEQPYAGDMYCLICRLLIPASDVPSHPTSIRHQLSKSPSVTVSNPLVPPIQYTLRPSSNVGYSMLQRLGWIEESGLGKTVQGRKTPIRSREKYDRTGLGVESKRRRMIEEMDGRILSRKEEEVLERGKKAAAPLAKNKKDMEKSRKREMQFFKDGIAYLHS